MSIIAQPPPADRPTTRRGDSAVSLPATTTTGFLSAPPASRFPAFPASWYYLGPSSSLRRKPRAVGKLGRAFVAFRGESGRAVLLDNRCPHQGADLAHGAVTGDCLRCPFHGWEFDAAGRCARVPSRPAPPPIPPLGAYPVVERHGHAFFFLGQKPTFDLPFFHGDDPARFAASRPFRVEYDAPWQMIACNGFDQLHFHVVHDRKVVRSPVIDEPEPRARRTRYAVRIVGDDMRDRLLRGLAGAEVDVELTVWAGTVVAVRARFRRAVSYVYFLIEPAGVNVTHMHVFAMKPVGGSPAARLAAAVSLEVRRIFTRGFVRHEQAGLGSVRYFQGALIEEDRPVVDYLHWLADISNR